MTTVALHVASTYAQMALSAARSAGDPYQDGDSCVVRAWARTQARIDLGLKEGPMIRVVANCTEDLRELEVHGRGRVYDIRVLLFRHPDSHPGVHILLRKHGDDALLVEGIEVHPAERGRGLVPVCLRALCNAPILLDKLAAVTSCARMAQLVDRHGTPWPAAPHLVKINTELQQPPTSCNQDGIHS